MTTLRVKEAGYRVAAVTLSIAAFVTVAMAVVLRPNSQAPNSPPASPGDASAVPEDPIEKIVARWLSGAGDGKEVYGLGRKALRALRAHKGRPEADALIARILARPLRVLYVEHATRYEYRFLKNALLRDPRMLAHCFLTSADEGFPQEHSKSDEPLFQAPLSRFPEDFKTLLQFDVLIYGDVDPAKLGPQALTGIKSFVKDFGGGIVFISGMMNNPLGLKGTPLDDLLPVVPKDTRDAHYHEQTYSKAYGYRLTGHGKEHAVTNFKEFKGDREKNLEHWEDRDGRRDGLVNVRWFQAIEKVKPHAAVLVEVPGEKGQDSSPLFVAREAGRGRAFWSATDETWLWRYLTGDEPWFYPFWRSSFEWAARDR